MLLLAAPHEDENKEEKYNPPLHPSQEGKKNQTMKAFSNNSPPTEGCHAVTGWVPL